MKVYVYDGDNFNQVRNKSGGKLKIRTIIDVNLLQYGMTHEGDICINKYIFMQQ